MFYINILNVTNNEQLKNTLVTVCDEKLEGKYSLESTDPREDEIRAPLQPLPYLMPISPNTLFFITNSTY